MKSNLTNYLTAGVFTEIFNQYSLEKAHHFVIDENERKKLSHTEKMVLNFCKEQIEYIRDDEEVECLIKVIEIILNFINKYPNFNINEILDKVTYITDDEFDETEFIDYDKDYTEDEIEALEKLYQDVYDYALDLFHG